MAFRQKDVYRGVFSALSTEAFQACFFNWLEMLRAQASADSDVDQPVSAVGGKTLRRCHHHNKGLNALHLAHGIRPGIGASGHR